MCQLNQLKISSFTSRKDEMVHSYGSFEKILPDKGVSSLWHVLKKEVSHAR
jgi:hypothetical protein